MAEEKSALTLAQSYYLDDALGSLTSLAIEPDDEQKACGRSVIAEMYRLAKEKGTKLSDIDKSNVVEVVNNAMLLRLNASSIPKTMYLTLQSNKKTNKMLFTFGVQGAGYEHIVRKFGVGVKKLMQPWIVHEGDELTLPAFRGLEVTPPVWIPKSYSGKVIYVVYPIVYEDGYVQYMIADRESVSTNLKAHIVNNTRFSPNAGEVKRKIEGMSLDELLNDPSLREFINDTYKGGNRESMIRTKMCINALKMVQRDFGNAYAARAMEESYDDYDYIRENQQASLSGSSASSSDVVKGVRLLTEKSQPKVPETAVIAYQDNIAESTTDASDNPEPLTVDSTKCPF